MQDAVRMAQAGARGAAESARLVFEKVTGLNTSSGHEGGGWARCGDLGVERRRKDSGRGKHGCSARRTAGRQRGI